MLNFTKIRSLFSRPSSRIASRAASPRCRGSSRLRVEALEGRALMSAVGAPDPGLVHRPPPAPCLLVPAV
jgi:hypothetical protein